jgi:hypothetical protein
VKIRNKKNSLNVLAYRSGAVIVKERIPGGAVVNIPGLVEFNQVVNKADFQNRGWFEIISENKVEQEIAAKNIDEVKQVEEYAEEKKKTKKTNNK